jgi:hypothetical protein
MPISSCKCSGLLFRSFSLSSTSSSPIHLLYIYFLPPHPHHSLYGMRTTIIVNEARTSTATLAPTTTKLKIERLRLHFALERATAPARSPSVPNVTRLRKKWANPTQCCPLSPPPPPTLADSTSGSAQPVFLTGHHAVQSEGMDGKAVWALIFRQRTSARGFPVFLPSVVMALRFSRGQVGASPSLNHHPEPSSL